MASHQLFVQNVAKKFSLFLVSKKQVLFGQKVDFKSPYATKLKRPTFGQTFQKVFLKGIF